MPALYSNRQQQPFQHGGEKFTPTELKALNMMKLSDRTWRLDNLYSIVNEHGQLVPFRLRPIQRDFLERMWTFNVILKSRQHGFTTLIDLWMLDLCLFTPRIEAVIIAHRQEDAAKILENKVEKPYANLHPALRSRIRLAEANKSMLKFENESSITVQISGRSGTAQAMHVSELGYTANHRPIVADEIITGSYSAVHAGSFMFIESTAMGSSGPFYDICQEARNMHLERKKLTPKDYKFHFYAWFDKPDNKLSDSDVEIVEIPDRLTRYFDDLLDKHGIVLTPNQKAWYVIEEKTLQERMKRENPSTPDEAFENSTVGNYFQRQLNTAREQGRVCAVPAEKSRLVLTAWDIGINDPTAVWFFQQVGPWFHFLGYYEETDLSLGENIEKVQELAAANGWRLGNYIGPHDMKQRRQSVRGPAISLEDEVKKIGVEFHVVNRVDAKNTSIDVARRMIGVSRFDAEGCKEGLKRLANYRKDWDELKGVFSDKPKHDANSDGADAYQTFGLWVEGSNKNALRAGMARKEVTPDQPIVADDENPQPYKGAARRERRNSMRAYT